jgi:transposase
LSRYNNSRRTWQYTNEFKVKAVQLSSIECIQVKSGMNTSELIKIMGEPALREFDQTSEEWNDCKTESNADEYVVINLQNSMLIGSILKGYTAFYLLSDWVETTTEILLETFLAGFTPEP